jgi:hypothetical protein
MPEIPFAKRDDRPAIAAWMKELEQRGLWDIENRKFPADVTALETIDGHTHRWWFDVKKTDNPDHMFVSATFTELAQAIRDPDHFQFVVAHQDKESKKWQFCEWTLDDVLLFGDPTIPPFKINFTIGMWDNCVSRDMYEAYRRRKKPNRGNGIPATLPTIKHLLEVHKNLPRRQPALDL